LGLREQEREAVGQSRITYVREPMTENMLCSGTFEGGKGACSGDSGGPLVVQLADGDYIQAGVVSLGACQHADEILPRDGAVFGLHPRQQLSALA